jgi:4-carboxymuconolactone decarboxylase
MTTYYHRRHLPAFPDIGRGHPELARAFFGYYGAVFADGALSVREKSLAALAVAHAVQCPYCIDAYTSGSLEAGADLEQLTEAIHVAAAVRAASTLMYGGQAFAQAASLAMEPGASTPSPSYFDRAHVDGRGDEASPALRDAERTWEAAVFAEGALDEREKAVVAIASAHALQCPYSIDRAVQAAQSARLELREMTEAVHVACAIRGGASLVHGLQMLEQLDASAM